MNTKDKRNVLAIGIFFIAVISRLLPHLPNFTPIESLALFGGAYFTSKRLAFILPIMAIYFTDFLLNNTLLRVFFPDQVGVVWYSSYMVWNALAMVGIVGVAFLIKNNIRPKSVIIGAVGSSLLFFIVTNFGVWVSSPVYPKTLIGLFGCFEAALPFFRNSLLSSVIFSTVLFGSFEIISNKYLAKIETTI